MEQNRTKQVAFSLSQEEIFVILRFLNTPTLMGLNHAILDGLEQRQIQIVLEVAERALLARGFLAPDKKKTLQLIPAVGGTLAVCVKPQASVIVTINRPGYATEALFFHFVKELIVSHVIPMSGIHQFTQLPDREKVLLTLAALIPAMPEMQIDIPAVLLPPMVISEARDAAVDGAESAVAVLNKLSDVPPLFVTEFAKALATMQMSLTLVAATHMPPNETADGFTVLQGAETLWWLRPLDETSEDQEPNLVQVRPIGRQSAIEAVRSLLKFEIH